MNAPPQILIATYNPGKLREFRSMLAGFPFALRGLNDFPAVTEVEETGSSFEENALLKARGYAKQTGHLTLADDSGLEVAALGGAPGVFSARYAGAEATDSERTLKLLEELSHTGDAERRARFVCVIALANDATPDTQTFKGICEGRIAHSPCGTQGFGYDPVFIPDGYQETFGELPASIKHSLSHRARALAAARAYLLERFHTHA
ncbi:MAG: RdgB/HAM1 family non-canonical purine NTP pyrophosphatase [Acidobacteria bacterium]|nr:RdgB/HAM1 family non-canonical purine NTP pyrophosphatase [Acidobacteriota bacterium]